jgi:hypothetical protein
MGSAQPCGLAKRLEREREREREKGRGRDGGKQTDMENDI